MKHPRLSDEFFRHTLPVTSGRLCIADTAVQLFFMCVPMRRAVLQSVPTVSERTCPDHTGSEAPVWFPMWAVLQRLLMCALAQWFCRRAQSGGVSAVGGVGGMRWAVGSHPAASHRLSIANTKPRVARHPRCRGCVVCKHCLNISGTSLLSLHGQQHRVILHQTATG